MKNLLKDKTQNLIYFFVGCATGFYFSLSLFVDNFTKYLSHSLLMTTFSRLID